MFTVVKISLLVALALAVFYVIAPPRGRAWLEERYVLVRIISVLVWRVLCGAVRGAREEFNREKGD